MAKRYKEPEIKEKKKVKKSPSNIDKNVEKKGKHGKEEIQEIKQEKTQKRKETKPKNTKTQKKKEPNLKTQREIELENRQRIKKEADKKRKQEERLKKQQEQKKIKEREERIEAKKREKQKQDFEFEADAAIRMTMRNNRDKKEQEKQIKIEKQKKRKNRIIRITILLILIIASILFALTSPIFNIKDIKVINNSQVSKENIISLSGLATGENLFKFLKVNVENSIKKNPFVESIEIKRILPNEIVIKVNERVKNFCVQFLGGYALINNQGYILEISQDGQALPNIKGMKTPEEKIKAGERLNDEDLINLETVIKIMNVCKDNNLDGKVTYIDISNQNEYIIYIEEETKKIHLGDKTNLSNKMVYVQAMINENQGVEGEIFVNGDLNNKFKPYFREKV